MSMRNYGRPISATNRSVQPPGFNDFLREVYDTDWTVSGIFGLGINIRRGNDWISVDFDRDGFNKAERGVQPHREAVATASDLEKVRTWLRDQ